MQNNYDIVVIGGGAAGFFSAINAAKLNPYLRIAILERGNKVLSKVKVSGGGRCNVTHAEFDPMELVKNYPRGEKELLGPFHRFMTGDTMAWFEDHGVKLKIEEDGRVFPISNDSQTIIDCFLNEVERLGIDLLKKQSVVNVQKSSCSWKISTKTDTFTTDKILVATGSSIQMWHILEKLGHTIVPPVPSLFTFNIRDDRISDLPGLATKTEVHILDNKRHPILKSQGPLLVTHWGLSGPAILKLSAWGARLLAKRNYRFTLQVNWTGGYSEEHIESVIKSKKGTDGKKMVVSDSLFNLPKRLWKSLVKAAGITDSTNWGDLTKKNIRHLIMELAKSCFEVKGKSTFKEEFVTAGGVELSEIGFKAFESKIFPKLYFAGEVLNIDAITGGFNFQSAWTGAFLAAKSMSAE